MPHFKAFLLVLLSISSGCKNQSSPSDTSTSIEQPQGVDAGREAADLPKIHTSGSTIANRFAPPAGYERVAAAEGSFGAYLRELPLKPAGSLVQYFDGRKKPAHGIYTAVIDLAIGSKDLHQCADAVMRLRADYLRSAGRADNIAFDLTNGFAVPYSKWRAGERVAVQGNKTWWEARHPTSDSDESYWQYLEFVWMYAGTASLSRELPRKALADMEIGDVLLQGGHPGHAVIVVDMAERADGGRAFMLAQSYMPAQELQVLVNPNNPDLSPWCELRAGEDVRTPEWGFGAEDLRAWD